MILQRPSTKSLIGYYNIFSVILEVHRRIEIFYLKFFENVREIIENDKNKPDQIFGIGIQLLENWMKPSRELVI